MKRGPGGDALDTRLVADVRRFYLFPEESYALADLAKLWRVSLDDVCAIFSDALTSSRPHGSDAGAFRVSWLDALRAATAFHIFRPVVVEQSLGKDFECARAARWRTVPLLVHLPRFIVDALAAMSFTPLPDSLAARAERLVCETVEAECLLVKLGKNSS